MKMLVAAVVLMTGLGQGAMAEQVDGPKTYDLLFRDGTLDDVSRDAALTYSRAVTNTLKPEAAERDSGAIALTIDDSGQAPVALLEFRQGDKHRGLGKFPASVGNPMIMYFYETVVRDMAESAGGSPFYIRNRVKEALVQPSEVIAGRAEVGGESVPTQTIRLKPFAEDPNRAQMQGFGDLELAVTMSEEVPGWYLSLEAAVPGEGAPLYHSRIAFQSQEAMP